MGYSKFIFLFLITFLYGCGAESELVQKTDYANPKSTSLDSEDDVEPRIVPIRLPQDVNPELVNIIPTNTLQENDQVVANASQKITGLEKMTFPQLEGEWQGEIALKGMMQKALLFVDKFGMMMVDVPEMAKLTHLSNMNPYEQNTFLADIVLYGQVSSIRVEYSNARIEFIESNAEGQEYTLASFGRKKQETRLDIQTLNDLKMTMNSSADEQDGLDIYFDKSGNGVVSIGDCQMSANAVDNVNFTTIRFVPRDSDECGGIGVSSAATSIVKMSQNNELEIRLLDEGENKSRRFNIDLEELLASSSLGRNSQ